MGAPTHTWLADVHKVIKKVLHVPSLATVVPSCAATIKALNSTTHTTNTANKVQYRR
jgi:hypothetical protein